MSATLAGPAAMPAGSAAAAGLRVAEFFAGIGLVRWALAPLGFDVGWANDNAPTKQRLYARNFDTGHFRLADLREVRGAELPDVELATASFPCTDLSLAGQRRGLAGAQSGMFWEFARVLHELGARRPAAVLLENVPSLGSSRAGADLARVIERLNDLGYSCDLLVLDARHFTPQSRARLFIVGAQAALVGPAGGIAVYPTTCWEPSALRPPWIGRFLAGQPTLRMHLAALPLPPPHTRTVADIAERLPADDERWWDAERLANFGAQLAPLQRTRLAQLRARDAPTWATAYRRTRDGQPVWEIRADALAGCLRTARGGSSKQALLETGGAHAPLRVRWMTAREYARLQGADDYDAGGVSENQALFGFGDAVCVPAVAWLGQHYLRPLLTGTHETSS